MWMNTNRRIKMCHGASSQSHKNTQFVYDECKSFSCARGLPDNPLRYHNGLSFRLHSDTSVLYLYWHICLNHFLQPSGFTAAEACFVTHATVHCLNPRLVASLWTLPLLCPNWILPWKQTRRGGWPLGRLLRQFNVRVPWSLHTWRS